MKGKRKKIRFLTYFLQAFTQQKTRPSFSRTGFGINFKLFRELRLAGGTENIDDLVHVELFELVAGGAEILSGIEFGGL